MPLAGETIIAGQVSGERIATDIDTADSAAITTTETIVMSVTAAVVSGRIYRVTFDGGFDLSVADDVFTARIREDNATGIQLQTRRMTSSSIDAPMPIHVEAEYTADATESKTLVVTFVRISGTGNIVLDASTSFPSYLYVDYIRG